MFKLLLAIAAVLPRVMHAFGAEDPIKGQPFYHEILTRRGARKAGWNAGSDVEEPEIGPDPDEDGGSAASSLAWHADYVDSYLYNMLWNAGGGIGRFKAALFAHDELIKVHFDDLTSIDQIKIMWARYQAGTVAGLMWAAERDDVPAARHIVGVGLHAAQDFYSHSSWVDDPARRKKTWFEVDAATRDDLFLYTGTYEQQEQHGFRHHGKLALDCTMMHQINDALGANVMDLLCGGISPLSDTGLCRRWKECKKSDVPTAPDTVAGVKIPDDVVVYTQPAGIALDSTWQSKINVANRELPDLPAGSPKQAVHKKGAELFDHATELAQRHTTQWLDQLTKIMQSAGYGVFWQKVTQLRRQGEKVGPGLPIISEYLEGYAEDVHQFEQPNKLPSTFLSAGSYPPDPSGDDEGWYIRLEVLTADDESSTGTNADIDVTLDGKTFRLDHGHDVNFLFEHDDFQGGDHTYYVVGPFEKLPTEITFHNRAADVLDVVEAAWNDFKNLVVSILESIVEFLGSLLGADADYIGSAKLDWTWDELEALADTNEGHRFKFWVDGGSEGKHDVTGYLWCEPMPNGSLKAHVELKLLVTFEESTIEGPPTPWEDEVVVMLLVNSPGAEQLVAWRSDPITNVDDDETHLIDMDEIVVDVPRRSGLILPLQLWESDLETTGRLNELLREFKSQYEEKSEGPKSQFLDALGAAILPDWKLGAFNAFAFRRGATVETTNLASGKVVDQWIEADRSLTVALDQPTIRRVKVPALAPAVTSTVAIPSATVGSVAVGKAGVFVTTAPTAAAPAPASGDVRQYGLFLEPGPSVSAVPPARSLAYDPVRNRIYALGVNEKLRMYDASSLQLLGTANVGFGAIDVAVDGESGYVYASRWSVVGAGVLAFSADDLSFNSEWKNGMNFLGALGLAVDPGISRVYAAQAFHSGGPGDPVVNALSSLSLEGALVLERTVELGGPGTQPVDVAVDAPNDLLFVSTLGNPDHHPGVYVIDRKTFGVLGMVPTPRVARAVACRPGTGLAYAVGEGGLTVIDGHNLAELLTVPLGRQPFAIAVDPDTGVAYVGDRFDGTLTRIDAIPGLG